LAVETNADNVNPGRPCFIVAGVVQASWAPASKHAANTSAPIPAACHRDCLEDKSSLTRFRNMAIRLTQQCANDVGTPGQSALPAPVPMTDNVIAGIAPYRSLNDATSAAPVGVTVSLRRRPRMCRCRGEFQGGRSRQRQHAMRTVDRPCPSGRASRRPRRRQARPAPRRHRRYRR